MYDKKPIEHSESLERLILCAENFKVCYEAYNTDTLDR